MTVTLLTAAALYSFVGWSLWRRIILPASPAPAPALPPDLRAWQANAILAEARGDLALLLPKATFVLVWPLALAFGVIAARLNAPGR
jgi:hypothetical protein